MSNIDILNLEPNKISRDLRGKFVLIYGPPKSGKTSFSSLFPRSLLCAFEKGYNALPGIHPVDIQKWSDFKKVCSQLKTEEAKKMYETVIIDTAGIAADMCEKFIINRNDVETLSDVAWGGGWNQFKKEFETVFRELTYHNYGIVFIAHNKFKSTGFVDKDGEDISSAYPDMSSTSMNIINKLVDVIAYLAVEFDKSGNSNRYLYMRQTPYVFAGSRYKHIAEKIPFGYQELVDAIGDAIEKAVQVDGAQVTEHTELKPVEAPFSEVVEEAKTLWAKLTKDNEENAKKILGLVKKHLKKEGKLSEITESQREILELIIEDMKAMS